MVAAPLTRWAWPGLPGGYPGPQLSVRQPGPGGPAHRQGIKVIVWNIDDPETLKPYLAMDLDAICTNRPREIIENLRGRGILARHLGCDPPPGANPRHRPESRAARKL